MIEVKNLTKKYGNHVAVDNLSFEVGENLIYGFLGPNGAGKSTTMNIMTGFIAPTSGSVTINGIDILESPEEAREHIGYLPEIPPVYQDMTVKEYLKFVSELKKVPKSERKDQLAEIEEMTGLTEMTDRLIKNLSKGFRQRVGLAEALVGFPEIIILDEPMVGLDPKQIIEIRDLILKLKENHTIILSSHILSEISMVCDKIMIISNGKLVALDTPDRLLAEGTGKEEYKLTVKANADRVREITGSLENMEIEINPDEEDGLTKVSIKSEPDEGLAERLFFLFADARTAITEMNHVTDSLEDIFLQLTSREPVSEEETKEEA